MAGSMLHGLAELVRDVPDFPRPGVTFRDITPLLADAACFARCIDAMAIPWLDSSVQAVCGIESRGFIFGAALAQKLGAGFVPLRKPGRLPPPVIGIDYSLEYGTDRLEARNDALKSAERAIIVDDVLATGGTLAAARALVEDMGADLLGAIVLIELVALQGRQRWTGMPALHSLLRY
jgi:adenine phosphoribosyltransferase